MAHQSSLGGHALADMGGGNANRWVIHTIHKRHVDIIYTGFVHVVADLGRLR